MEGTLKDILSDIRAFLYGGTITFPITIAGTLLILGLFTANYAIIFFLIGYLLLAPTSAWIFDFALKYLVEMTGTTLFNTKRGDVCKVFIPFQTVKNPTKMEDSTVVISQWVALVSFFIGYMFKNALELYNREPIDNTLTVTTSETSDIKENKTMRRTSQSMIALISIVIFAMIVIGLRYYSGCESLLSIVLTFSAFIFMGSGWYNLLSPIGQDRLSDLFGIANRLLPPSAIANKPIACVPVPV